VVHPKAPRSRQIAQHRRTPHIRRGHGLMPAIAPMIVYQGGNKPSKRKPRTIAQS